MLKMENKPIVYSEKSAFDFALQALMPCHATEKHAAATAQNMITAELQSRTAKQNCKESHHHRAQSLR